MRRWLLKMSEPENLARRLMEIGAALSAEENFWSLLEEIVSAACELTASDGGTLYLVDEERKALLFALVRTDSLGIKVGGEGEPMPPFPPIDLKCEKGAPNSRAVASTVANSKKTVNIADIYQEDRFDFTGSKRFDVDHGYQTKSILTVPLLNHEKEVVAVLQLINRQRDGHVVPFSHSDQMLCEALAGQAAVILSKQQLIDSLKGMLESFIEAIADAIDAKSSHTGHHCRRVPVIAEMLAEAVNQSVTGPLADFQLSEEELYELKIAALLHDCGKVTTPVHVVDKATRLETVRDGIETIDTRFEVLKRDIEIRHLREAGAQLDQAKLWEELRVLGEQQELLRQCNSPSHFNSKEVMDRIREIGARTWECEGEERPLLTEEELSNFSIERGTLNTHERKIINDHVVATINMLSKLPYPKKLKNVPEIAGAHHERMDGSGYPKGLKGEEMSVQAKILALADVFEALTSKDRPYKKPIPLEKSMAILEEMTQSGHIDPSVYEVFREQKVHLEYSKNYL